MVRRRSALTASLLLAALVLPARAADVLLHQYFEPRPAEDLSLGATTIDGSMPAALETPSGVIPAPPAERTPSDSESAYGGTSTPESADASYRIDRNTTRPDVVDYSDPFTPALTPFKRLYAYDSVDEHLELVVSDKKLRPLVVGGRRGLEEEEFFGDFLVELEVGVAVRIPSIGPGAHVIAARLDPPGEFTLLEDGAENWFVRANQRRRARVVVQLAIPRAVFGSLFANTEWSALRAQLPNLPDSAVREGRAVLETLGVSQRLKPRAAVTRLIEHFRSFAPSKDLPSAPPGPALYRELALSKKGVCRHRAYAFTITALALGVPTRLVRNEAHAWVEVWDGSLWHRVDLGGAAGELDAEQASNTPPHRPPADPYTWPDGSESATDLADRSQNRGNRGATNTGSTPNGATTGSSAAAASSAPSSGANSSSGSTANATPGAASSKANGSHTPLDPGDDMGAASDLASADGAQDETDPRQDGSAEPTPAVPRAALTLALGAPQGQRGGWVEVSGDVRADGRGCAQARVDISLRRAGAPSVFVGAVPTDDTGRFTGRVTIPLDVDVGDYQVVASTPGTASCGAVSNE